MLNTAQPASLRGTHSGCREGEESPSQEGTLTFIVFLQARAPASTLSLASENNTAPTRGHWLPPRSQAPCLCGCPHASLLERKGKIAGRASTLALAPSFFPSFLPLFILFFVTPPSQLDIRGLCPGQPRALGPSETQSWGWGAHLASV